MRSSFLIFFYFCAACSDMSEHGFTNKAEAKNEMVNGKKEGKWIEYFDVGGGGTCADTTAKEIFSSTYPPLYRLVVYKDDDFCSTERVYDRSGRLRSEVPYTYHHLEGVEKDYYSDGKLKSETTYGHNSFPITVKNYDENGNEIKNAVQKDYYKNGKIISETIIKDGGEQGTRYYDESSNEIKQ